jgi:hypothetical protein
VEQGYARVCYRAVGCAFVGQDSLRAVPWFAVMHKSGLVCRLQQL